MRMTLHGSPPTEMHDAILAAGFVVSERAEVVLHWQAAGEPAQPGAIVLVSDLSRLSDALQSDALAVIVASEAKAVTLQLQRWVQQHAQQHQSKTTRRLQEHRLSTVKKLHEEVLRTTTQPIVASDQSGQIVIFNQAAVELLGYNIDYACSHLHVSDIYANPTEARRVLAEIRCSPDGYLHRFSVRVRARSGAHIAAYLSATEILSERGEPIYTLGILQDRRIELALRRRLDTASEQVLSSERRASGASATRVAIHELNQPLTALMGAVELLDMRTDISNEVRERLNRMYDQLERMAEIVRGLGGGITPQESL